MDVKVGLAMDSLESLILNGEAGRYVGFLIFNITMINDLIFQFLLLWIGTLPHLLCSLSIIIVNQGSCYMIWTLSKKKSKIELKKYFLFMQLWFCVYWCWEKNEREIFWTATTAGKNIITWSKAFRASYASSQDFS